MTNRVVQSSLFVTLNPGRETTVSPGSTTAVADCQEETGDERVLTLISIPSGH